MAAALPQHRPPIRCNIAALPFCSRTPEKSSGVLSDFLTTQLTTKYCFYMLQIVVFCLLPFSPALSNFAAINPDNKRKAIKPLISERFYCLVGEGGFEPPKALPADLQSVPFGHSGIPPYSIAPCGAGGRTRTPDLLITNQLLYRLSYTSILPASPVFR